MPSRAQARLALAIAGALVATSAAIWTTVRITSTPPRRIRVEPVAESTAPLTPARPVESGPPPTDGPNAIAEAIERCIGRLPPEAALSAASAAALTAETTDLLSVHIEGSFEGFRHYMETRGRLGDPMFQWDLDRQHRDWETRSRTLLNAPVDPQTVTVRPRVRAGREVACADRARITGYPPAGPGVHDDDVMPESAYEIVIPTIVPDIDGGMHSVRIGIWFAAEGGGAWKHWKYCIYDLEPGVHVYLPVM